MYYKSQYQLKNICDMTDCFSTNLKTVPVFKLSYFLFLIYDLIMTLLYFIVFYCCIHVCHEYHYCHLYSCSFVTSPTLSVSRQMTFILRVSIRSRSLPFGKALSIVASVLAPGGNNWL